MVAEGFKIVSKLNDNPFVSFFFFGTMSLDIFTMHYTILILLQSYSRISIWHPLCCDYFSLYACIDLIPQLLGALLSY